MDPVQIAETWPWTGRVRVTIRHDDGTVTVEEFDNLIVNAGLNLLRGCLDGTVTDGKIKYVAIGTSGTAPAASDTQLGAEVYRQQVTKQTEQATAGQLLTTTVIGPASAVGTVIAEIGWFAGASATSTANSGTLVAHVLYSHTHTNTESIEIDRTDQI